MGWHLLIRHVNTSKVYLYNIWIFNFNEKQWIFIYRDRSSFVTIWKKLSGDQNSLDTGIEDKGFWICIITHTNFAIHGFPLPCALNYVNVPEFQPSDYSHKCVTMFDDQSWWYLGFSKLLIIKTWEISLSSSECMKNIEVKGNIPYYARDSWTQAEFDQMYLYLFTFLSSPNY